MSSPLAGALMMTFLAPAVEVGAGLVGVGEEARRLEDDVHPEVAPRQRRGVLLLEDLDLAAVDDQGVLGVVDGAGVGAVGRVVLEQERVEARLDEVVDGHDLDVRAPARGCALRDCRPIRPKPLIPTRTDMVGTSIGMPRPLAGAVGRPGFEHVLLRSRVYQRASASTSDRGVIGGGCGSRASPGQSAVEPAAGAGPRSGTAPISPTSSPRAAGTIWTRSRGDPEGRRPDGLASGPEQALALRPRRGRRRRRSAPARRC